MLELSDDHWRECLKEGRPDALDNGRAFGVRLPSLSSLVDTELDELTELSRGRLYEVAVIDLVSPGVLRPPEVP